MHGGSFGVQRDCNRDESTAVLHETCGTAALFVGCAKKSPKRLLTKTLVKLIGGGGKIKVCGCPALDRAGHAEYIRKSNRRFL